MSRGVLIVVTSNSNHLEGDKNPATSCHSMCLLLCLHATRVSILVTVCCIETDELDNFNAVMPKGSVYIFIHNYNLDSFRS